MRAILRCVFLPALLAMASAAIADDERYDVGSWRITKVHGIQIAANTNESGSVVGVLCIVSREDCISYVIFSAGCDEGARYPMMINSAVGAYPIKTTCRQLPGSTDPKDKIYVIEEFGSVKAALESGGEVGFVMPLRSGRFNVARFNAVGATPAIKDVMTLPAGRSTPTRPPRSRDQLL